MQHDFKRKKSLPLPPHQDYLDKGKMHLANVFTNKNIKLHLLSKRQAPQKEERVSQKSLYYYTRHPQDILLPKIASISKIKNNGDKFIELAGNKNALTLTQVLANNLDEKNNVQENKTIESKSIKELPQMIGQGFKTNVNFQSPINKIKFEMIQCLSKLINPNDGNYFPSFDRIQKVLEMLSKIGEENSVFENFMEQVLVELKRAIFFQPGEFFEIFPASQLMLEGNNNYMNYINRDNRIILIGVSRFNVFYCNQIFNEDFRKICESYQKSRRRF